MPSPRRGTVYRLDGGSVGLYGVLVLTNDVWNRRMRTVGVVPVRAAASESLWEPIVALEPHIQTRVGFLASLPAERLIEARFVLTADQIRPVEAALADILALTDLCATPAMEPPLVPGLADYPRWGEVYYAGPPIHGQVKRYAVVSRDDWNARAPVAIAVRTTSQDKSWGRAFPAILGGSARACCGDATTLVRGRFDLSGRPSPATLSFEDMVRVAWGLADVFELGRAPRD